MHTKTEKLNSRQEKFCLAMAGGATLGEAGKEIGISVTTAYRWTHRPEIAQRIRDLQSQTTGAAVAALKARLRSAVEILFSLAEDTGTPPQVRCSAAARIVETGLKSLELSEVLNRLEELERKYRNREVSGDE